MKKILIYFFMSGTVFVAACSQEKIYTKPELVGELYDSKTKRPIINTEGYVDFYLGEKRRK